MVAREFVIVDGNNKNGSVIPVKIPYDSSETDES